jgi:perosamine synthetase
MIPVNEPSFGERELEYVAQCVRSGWVSSAGRFIKQFEQEWAQYCGRKYGVAVSNGTTALQLALRALDLNPGDEVIMPTFTNIACALAVIYAGGAPVLVDSDPGHWTMSPGQVAKKITPRTRAVMAVHIYGHPAEMDAILKLAEENHLAVVEDAAEAHGAEVLSEGVWRRCGSLGTFSCFSFYANKPVTTGEGGMVLTDEASLAERLRSLRNLCYHPERRFFHEEMGYNFRITNLQAALGLAQVERIDQIVSKKQWMLREYNRRLDNFEGIKLQTQEPWTRSICWMYGILVTEQLGMGAEAVAKKLATRGVETRPFFLGMHEQPAFHKRGLFLNEHYRVAERLARQGLYLPSGIALTESQLDQVCRTLREVVA